MQFKKPFFITFEGIDGSGKTTQINKLYKKLIDQNIKIHITSEPTNNFIGKIIQDIIINKKEVNQHTISALFLADRLEHILNPKYGMLYYLKSNISIICDRYYFSSYAYNSINVNQKWIIDCNQKCKELLKPDLIIFFDISLQESLVRIEKRKKNNEYDRNINNLIRVQKNYLKILDSFKNEENILFINANQNKEAVFLDLWKGIKKRLFKKI